VLVGQDLSFSDDGRTHAVGMPFGERETESHDRKKFSVPGNLGQPVTTHLLWHEMLKEFERDVANYKGTCVNSTEAGALIPGTEVIPLAEATARYFTTPYDARAMLHAVHRTPRAADVASVSAIVEHYRGTATVLRSLLEKARVGYDAAVEAVAAGPPGDAGNTLEAVLRMTPFSTLEHMQKAVLTEDTDLFQLFLMNTIQSVHWRSEIAKIAYDYAKLSPLEFTRKLLDVYPVWFKCVHTSIQRSLDILREGEQRLSETMGTTT
jgi:hypothetical protein